MQMAMAVGECTGEDADLLRRAMGSKRGVERIESLREKLYAGMATNGLVGRGRRRHLRARSRRSRTSASPSRTRCRSGCSSTRARGSSCTTPRRSSRGCCARSRWASTRPRPSPPTPAGTGSRCCGPTCCARASQAVLEPVDASADARVAVASEPTYRDSQRRPAWTACAHRIQPPVGRLRPHAPDESAAHRRDGALRGAAGPRRGQGHRRRPSPSASSPSARRAGAYRDLPRPGAPRRAHAGAARGARDRRGVRVPRAQPPRGDLARRLGRPGPRRVPPRLARRRCSRRCSPTRRATSGSPATCGRPASPPTTTR